MRRESLDTNVILRLMLRDIPDQFEAAKKLVHSPGKRFFVSDAALIELVYVLDRHYEFSRSQIVELLSGFMMLKEIDCNREVMQVTLRYFSAHKSLSFTDCYLVAIAKTMNAPPLWTFDKELSKKLPEAKLLTGKKA
ncbi:MAG: PIN domain-containing protein [Coriobacteriia bacterium]|nr:PIN domain-containing protein [Coriobacteriia bacterium]